MSTNIHSDRGFAIVELLVTIVTIGIIFSAFMTTFTTIQTINKKASDVQKANSLAFEKTQTYENKSFSSIPVFTPYGTLNEVEDFSNQIPSTVHPPRLGKVYVSTISPTLKQVIVWLEYGQGNAKQTIQYSNLIQRNGVGR